MPLLALNDDVLDIIVSFLSPHDALPLMTTCRTAHALALPRLLSEVEFLTHTAKTPGRITQFCQFMLADIPHRMPHLRALRLIGNAFATKDFDYSAALAMAAVLRHAKCLRELHLRLAGELLACQPRFADAVAALASLDVLCMSSRMYSWVLLARMRATPRRVEFFADYMAYKDQQRLFWGAALPVRLAPRLEQVRLEMCVPLAENADALRAAWPHVRELTLVGEVCRMDALARAFPNVRFVRFQDVDFVGKQAPPGWSELDHAQWNVVPRHPLGCKVRRLDVQAALPAASDEVGEGFVEVLESASPAVLLCTLPQRGDFSWMMKIAKAAPELKYVHVAAPSLDEAITSCQDAFAKLPLAGLSLGYTSRMPAFDDGERCAASDARKIAAAIPSLRYVGLNVKAFAAKTYGDLENITWFRVVSRAHDGSPPSMVVVSESERIAAQEWLLRSPRG
ncbi:uncharacterized protein LAESUDRAFT_810066 [Laetiporus sulphureus 93-53]|uniref:F-box domain-containing protein n=1 Tax=Laetiporus sulphureus 93-53 TaxID=1314785 RepID=A0A165GIX2_9APHY|nr:uncharacterized protein LAESUDRAFT_810066 [Laetiporus sulphureus 93-53]KZT10410.1 hypothetical protein LAESUDRAFT_810066 [Laetiporus sulphureus 93-53]